MTVTALAIGRTWIWVRYGDYVDTSLGVSGGRIQQWVSLEVLESQGTEPAARGV